MLKNVVFTGITTVKGVERLQCMLFEMGHEWATGGETIRCCHDVIRNDLVVGETGTIYHSPKADTRRNSKEIDVSWLDGGTRMVSIRGMEIPEREVREALGE